LGITRSPGLVFPSSCIFHSPPMGRDRLSARRPSCTLVLFEADLFAEGFPTITVVNVAQQ
jgi:hypothetical protein